MRSNYVEGAGRMVRCADNQFYPSFAGPEPFNKYNAGAGFTYRL